MAHRHLEDDHQKALFDWMSHQRLKLPFVGDGRAYIRDYAFAIPNGGSRNPKEAARMKGQGVTAGVPDLMLAIPAGGWAGLFIELKRPITKGEKKPTTSASQKKKLALFNAAGYLAVVCYGWHDAKLVVSDYLSGDAVRQSLVREKAFKQ